MKRGRSTWATGVIGGRSLAQAATVALPSSTAPISANFLEGRIGGSPWWLH
ncbi:hypothetical protein [Rhodanobacter sp. 115]|uniref:hypothetical protein n=1 Tax=Rhodanobacter sp. FW021-MT20 TaxID=1162282 RepID=UPI001ED94E55|nr:hypothetical protein [Rhodanobacter sp. 115]